MRTGNGDGTTPDRGTFTQTARRAQLVGCAIDALAEVGYQQTTVAEVARRAAVSKGVVTYYFPARDDLVWAVVAAVFASVGEHVGTRLEGVPPSRFVAIYLGAWVDYYRDHRREMTAIAEIWTSFRDASGHPHLDARTLGRERALVEAALAAGQAEGTLGDFSPRVVAVTLKAALDGLLAQLAMEPALDLDAYLDELVALFDRATRAALFLRAQCESPGSGDDFSPGLRQAWGPWRKARTAASGRAPDPDVPRLKGDAVAPKTAIVAGAGGALGRATAKALAASGLTVVGIDRSEKALGDLPDSVRREVADSTDPAVVAGVIDRIVGEVGPPDVLVNTIGAFSLGDALAATPDALHHMIDVNLGPALWLSQAVTPHMRQQGSGAIVHVAARPGIDPTGGMAAYSVSKAALIHLTRVLDVELRPYGIRVNAVVPELMDTPYNRTAFPAGALEHAVAPEAVAETIAFLVSDAATPVSGAVVPAYGA